MLWPRAGRKLPSPPAHMCPCNASKLRDISTFAISGGKKKKKKAKHNPETRAEEEQGQRRAFGRKALEDDAVERVIF